MILRSDAVSEQWPLAMRMATTILKAASRRMEVAERSFDLAVAQPCHATAPPAVIAARAVIIGRVAALSAATNPSNRHPRFKLCSSI